MLAVSSGVLIASLVSTLSLWMMSGGRAGGREQTGREDQRELRQAAFDHGRHIRQVLASRPGW